MTKEEQVILAIRNGPLAKSNEEMEIAIKKLLEMHSENGVPNSVYVIEECSELTKELTKKQRWKGSDKDIISEACDVLATVFLLLTEYGVSRTFVRDQILYKYNRAIEKYNSTGEL